MSRTRKITPSFTIIELLIIVVIILGVYGLFFANLSKSKEENSTDKNLINIRYILSKYPYDKSIEVHCTNDDYRCFVLVDGVLKEELKEKLFDSNPTVYSYDRYQTQIRFNDLELEQLERYPISFVYKINKYGKSQDMIVEVNNKVYLFNSLFDKPTVYENLSDVKDYFEKENSKVRDVF
ncbi:MAG: hypothetical protein PHF17_10130 [Arcobacteraceae bacterium]|nr:hypothetical protein [Arcobacteraceae bacterium]